MGKPLGPSRLSRWLYYTGNNVPPRTTTKICPKKYKKGYYCDLKGAGPIRCPLCGNKYAKLGKLKEDSDGPDWKGTGHLGINPCNQRQREVESSRPEKKFKGCDSKTSASSIFTLLGGGGGSSSSSAAAAAAAAADPIASAADGPVAPAAQDPIASVGKFQISLIHVHI